MKSGCEGVFTPRCSAPANLGGQHVTSNICVMRSVQFTYRAFPCFYSARYRRTNCLQPSVLILLEWDHDKHWAMRGHYLIAFNSFFWKQCGFHTYPHIQFEGHFSLDWSFYLGLDVMQVCRFVISGWQRQIKCTSFGELCPTYSAI